MRNRITLLLSVGLAGIALGQSSCPSGGTCQGGSCSTGVHDVNRTIREEHLDIAELIVVGDCQGAVTRLKRLIWLKTANAKTYALLALAYNRLGSWEASLEASNEALKRGEDTPILHRERAASWAGLKEYERGLRELRKADSADPRTVRMREEMKELSGRKTSKDVPSDASGEGGLSPGIKQRETVWIGGGEDRLSLALEAGWETVESPVAPQRGWPSLEEISEERDESAHFRLDASYRLGDPGKSLDWGPSVSVFRNFYDDLSEYEYSRVQGGLFAEMYRFRWMGRASAELASVWLGEKGYTKSVNPGLRWTYLYPKRAGTEQWSELFLEASYFDYVGDSPSPEENRSGWFPGVSLSHTVFLNASESKFGMGGYWRNHSTLGASYVGDLLGVQVFWGQTLPLDFQLQLKVGFEGDWFENRSVPSGTRDLREDEAFFGEAKLEKTIVDGVSFFLRYAHNDSDSNLDPLFTYRQNVFNAGVALSH